MTANKTSGLAEVQGKPSTSPEQAPAGAPVPHDGDAAPSTAKAPAGSPAETLRAAAALMKSRAEGVTPGAQWTGGNYWITDYDPSDPSGQTAMQRLIGGMNEPDDQHYSSWHPTVALAVADLLEGVAERHASQDNPWSVGQPYCPTCNLDLEGDERGHCDDFDDALAAAHAYLGGES